MGSHYRDKRGRLLFVDRGISGAFGCPVTWATYWRKPSGNLKRVVSRHLPPRSGAELAQADLDWYARRHKLEAIECE